jgi:glycosyltransferase involved in cell wall biosynthesis
MFAPPPPAIAFITPWYGAIPGGMEALTRETAERLAARGHPVEVWTTCIRDFLTDWSRNHHRPGVTQENGVTVRRFPVQRRDQVAFDAVNLRLMSGLPVSADQERTWLDEMIRCPDLTDHIARHQHSAILLFIPYLFSTTLHGAPIAPHRSAIIPCLHDEAYARLPVVRRVLPAVHTLLFNTWPEAELAGQLYGPAGSQVREVVGIGVETGIRASADAFLHRHHLTPKPTLLCVGRRDAGKNVPLLVDYWSRHIAESGADERLILIGPGEVAIPPEMRHHILDAGFVSPQEKQAAYAAATALCQPSRNESFSLVLMENWLLEKPALVHAHCAVTRDHCRRANGGLWFGNYAEFVTAWRWLRDHPAQARQMGQQGRRYVLENFDWPLVLARYEAAIGRIQAAT